ncbi:MAG: DUF6064 family protein [Aestuariivirga sp.]
MEPTLGIFAAYNAAIWPLQIVAYCAGLLAFAALWLKRLRGSCLIPAVLAILWVRNGIGYHFLYFSTINPLAPGFAAFFVLQAILFAASATRANCIVFTVAPRLRSGAGLALLLYALLIYPVLGILAGHGLMAGPMFGVAPCPTTIFTIGLLLLARGSWVPWLSIIPFLWSLVGLAAALQLGIPEDLGLPAAGLLLLIALATGSYRERPEGKQQALKQTKPLTPAGRA